MSRRLYLEQGSSRSVALGSWLLQQPALSGRQVLRLPSFADYSFSAAKEMGQLSLIDALTLVACYARTGSPKFEKAAVRWLVRIAEEQDASLRDIRLAANALEALKTRHHDLAEKMLLRFL